MTNKYQAHTKHGQAYDVTTDHHHDDHTEDNFKGILAKIIQGAATGTASGIAQVVVTQFIFKGKAKPPAAKA